jgi:hypothetical protein
MFVDVMWLTGGFLPRMIDVMLMFFNGGKGKARFDSEGVDG